MKIRLAKKIMKCMPIFPWEAKHIRWRRNNASKYWKWKFTLYCCDGILGDTRCDHRITKAITITRRWEFRMVMNDAKKLEATSPFKPSDLLRACKKLKEFSV